MRKHRLFGVVIGVLIGLGACTHQSDTVRLTSGRLTSGHLISGPHHAGVPPTAAEFSADRVGPPVQTTVAADTSHTTPQALLDLVAGHAVAILSSPFGPQALVADTHIALVNEQTEADAYVAAVAQQRAAVKAYLQSLKPPPPPPAPPVRVTTAPARAVANPWAALRQCESNGNYGEDSGNGYYGAYQFTIGTWRSLGLGGLPSQASPAAQDQAAQQLQARRGWSQWPSCARRLGLI
jgi:resuscitation-promoting factor RpfB